MTRNSKGSKTKARACAAWLIGLSLACAAGTAYAFTPEQDNFIADIVVMDYAGANCPNVSVDRAAVVLWFANINLNYSSTAYRQALEAKRQAIVPRLQAQPLEQVCANALRQYGPGGYLIRKVARTTAPPPAPVTKPPMDKYDSPGRMVHMRVGRWMVINDTGSMPHADLALQDNPVAVRLELVCVGATDVGVRAALKRPGPVKIVITGDPDVVAITTADGLITGDDAKEMLYELEEGEKGQYAVGDFNIGGAPLRVNFLGIKGANNSMRTFCRMRHGLPAQ